jgi:hypothetical protein
MENTENLKRKSRKLRVALIVGIVFFAVFLFGILADQSVIGDRRPRTVVLMMCLNEANSAFIADNGAWPKKFDNAGLFAVLSGADSGKVYVTFKTREISRNGELLDEWETPLRVTRVSDIKLKIESAGPDKIFGTADDITNQ